MVETDLFKTEFIPSVKPSEKLMIVLHGKGDSLRPFRHFDEELQIPEMNYLLVNAPKKYLTGYSWYGDPPYQSSGVLRVRRKMLKLLAQLKQMGWKSENIYLFGFSQGCLVSADLAMSSKEKLGGVIGISGYFHLYSNWRKKVPDCRRTPWLLTHGRKDDVLPLDETKRDVQKLKKAGLKIDWIELDKKHVFLEEEYPLIRSWVREKIKNLN